MIMTKKEIYGCAFVPFACSSPLFFGQLQQQKTTAVPPYSQRLESRTRHSELSNGSTTRACGDSPRIVGVRVILGKKVRDQGKAAFATASFPRLEFRQEGAESLQ
jgi:hypothetical protein